jgi:cellulose synthase/poly-beta-1,6-N-acetylglucosamine synthase-like glycosyltransferase
MTVSIIIAVKTWQKNLENCVNKCQELDFPDFEIIVLPDEPLCSGDTTLNSDKLSVVSPELSAGISVFPTGPVCPSDKRDIALKYAKGEIIAFIDDDAYPVKDWLKNAVEIFKDEDVAAVGGPAVTPQEDSLLQRASGAVFASFVVSGKFTCRYLPRERRQVYDYPSCNLLVRKSVLAQVGGFNTVFWPGEDTKLCLDIVKKLGMKIIYDPGVLVYHHRRRLFLPHLKQVSSYALHRGYFVKKYPETSFRLPYFLPTFFVLGLGIVGVLALFLAPLRVIYLAGVSVYLFMVFISSIHKDLRLIIPVFSGIIFTHIAYGIYFLKGIFSGKLSEER